MADREELTNIIITAPTKPASPAPATKAPSYTGTSTESRYAAAKEAKARRRKRKEARTNEAFFGVVVNPTPPLATAVDWSKVSTARPAWINPNPALNQLEDVLEEVIVTSGRSWLSVVLRAINPIISLLWPSPLGDEGDVRKLRPQVGKTKGRDYFAPVFDDDLDLFGVPESWDTITPITPSLPLPMDFPLESPMSFPTEWISPSPAPQTPSTIPLPFELPSIVPFEFTWDSPLPTVSPVDSPSPRPSFAPSPLEYPESPIPTSTPKPLPVKKPGGAPRPISSPTPIDLDYPSSALDTMPLPNPTLTGVCPPCENTKKKREKARNQCWVILTKERTMPSDDKPIRWRKIKCQ